ncbi:Mrp/NBP35 family ATP-binding protein [Niallia sp. 01092]|uniref:Mrp/NBP35 family ATP-binding protein n=1 Tax=unclassified Niallia TaxID=2837522 RepID=UPI003FD09441
MLSKEQVLNVLDKVKDPVLQNSITVQEVKIKENHVSIKVLLTKANSSAHIKVQQEIVRLLKEVGAETVGLRFEELNKEDPTLAEKKQVKSSIPSLLSSNSQTSFITVASGKGGVGKSTVSANLAVALSRLGKRVGLIDADIYGFSIPNMMGIETRPEIKEGKIVPPERFGVKVMSMDYFIEDNSPVIWRGPMLGKMLNSFFSEVEWGELDYLLLDLPPGTGDVALDVHSLLPTSKEIIVTTPHPTAAFVAVRAGVMARKSNHEILGVVENMAYFESNMTGEREYVFGRGGGEKLVEELSTDLLGKLPLSPPNDSTDFAPSIYGTEHPLAELYKLMAEKVTKKAKDVQLI